MTHPPWSCYGTAVRPWGQVACLPFLFLLSNRSASRWRIRVSPAPVTYLLASISSFWRHSFFPTTSIIFRGNSVKRLLHFSGEQAALSTDRGCEVHIVLGRAWKESACFIAIEDRKTQPPHHRPPGVAWPRRGWKQLHLLSTRFTPNVRYWLNRQWGEEKCRGRIESLPPRVPVHTTSLLFPALSPAAMRSPSGGSLMGKVNVAARRRPCQQQPPHPPSIFTFLFTLFVTDVVVTQALPRRSFSFRTSRPPSGGPV